MAVAEQLTLAFLCLGCSVHWVRYATQAPAAAISAAIAAHGGGDSGGTAAASHPWMHLELCAVVTTSAILLALSHTRWWSWLQPWAAASLRLAAFFAMPPSLSWAPLLAERPGGALMDALRVFFGSKAWRLLVFGTGLPLGLPAHLLVHTLCLARVLADVPAACSMPLLSADLPAERVAAFHAMIEALGTAGILHGFPPGGRKVQCAAALNTLCIFVGWLVPTYFALRRCHKQALQRRLEPAPIQQAPAALLGSRQRGWAPEPAGAAPSPQHSGSSTGSSQGQPSRRSAPVGRRQPAGRPQVLVSEEGVVAWLLGNVFLEGAPPGLAPTAWWILAVLCWMAGGMLAILAS